MADQEEEDVAQSALTELALILVFTFMLVAAGVTALYGGVVEALGGPFGDVRSSLKSKLARYPLLLWHDADAPQAFAATAKGASFEDANRRRADLGVDGAGEPSPDDLRKMAKKLKEILGVEDRAWLGDPPSGNADAGNNGNRHLGSCLWAIDSEGEVHSADYLRVFKAQNGSFRVVRLGERLNGFAKKLADDPAAWKRHFGNQPLPAPSAGGGFMVGKCGTMEGGAFLDVHDFPSFGKLLAWAKALAADIPECKYHASVLAGTFDTDEQKKLFDAYFYPGARHLRNGSADFKRDPGAPDWCARGVISH